MTRRRFSERDYAARLLEFDGCCAECGNKIGGVHGAIEWDHELALEMGGEDTIENLRPVHPGCHKKKTARDIGQIAKAKRMNKRDAGIRRQSRNPLPGSKASKWKKKLDGTVVPR